MKKAEIKVGGHYKAKVSGNLVTVRVDEIREVAGVRPMFGRTPYSNVYDVTNLKTGRKTTFRSAAKFRSVAGPVPGTSPQEVADTMEALSAHQPFGKIIKLDGSQMTDERRTELLEIRMANGGAY